MIDGSKQSVVVATSKNINIIWKQWGKKYKLSEKEEYISYFYAKRIITEEKSVKKNDQKILCLNLRSSEVYAIIDNQPRAYAKLSDDRCSNQTLNENGEVTAIEISQEKFSFLSLNTL